MTNWIGGEWNRTIISRLRPVDTSPPKARSSDRASGMALSENSTGLTCFNARMRPRLIPCPCGYFVDLKRECRCGQLQVQRYRQRISGPLLDRIDLHIEVPAVETVTSRALAWKRAPRRFAIARAVLASGSRRVFVLTRRSTATHGWDRARSNNIAN